MPRSSRLTKAAARLLSHCPVCGRRDTRVSASFLGEQDGAQLLYMRCGYGKHAFLTLVLTNGELVSSIGLVTDLSVEDIARLRKRRSLSIDDVLRTHTAFQNTAFVRALQERSVSPSAA